MSDDDDAEEQRLLGRIDAEIVAMLQVMPEAGFAARVRQRVSEPRPPAWRGWLVPLAAAAAVGFIALWWRPVPAPIAPRATAPRSADGAPPAIQAAPGPSPMAMTRVPARRVSRTPALPEILVPREEREALRRYLEDLQRQQARVAAHPTLGLEASAAPVTDRLPDDLSLLSAPQAIEIGPIRIALIGVQLLTMDSWNEE
jgi:hypothetical protein